MVVRQSGHTLESFVEEKRMVALLSKMVTIKSVTGEEGPMAQFLNEEFSRMGLDVQLMSAEPNRPNVIGRLKGSIGTPVLIFNGHIDTVPIGDPTLWSTDPFTPIIKDGRLYGRGSCDMKAGLAAMIEAVKAIQDSGIKLKGDIVLECVVDEERGGYLGTKYVTDNGILGDYCINCDIGELKVGICSKGDYGVEIVTHGKAAHASMPELGINAVHQMLKIATKLRRIPVSHRWSTRRHKLVGPPLINISVIEGGLQRNMVPDRCRMVVDRRTVPGFESLDVARQEIVSVIENMKSSDQHLKDDVNEIIAVDAYEISENERLVQTLVSAAKRVLGKKPKLSGCKGFTDGHWLTVNHKIPCATFGGIGGGVHAVDEFAEIASFVNSARIYALAAVNLLG